LGAAGNHDRKMAFAETCRISSTTKKGGKRNHHQKAARLKQRIPHQTKSKRIKKNFATSEESVQKNEAILTNCKNELIMAGGGGGVGIQFFSEPSRQESGDKMLHLGETGSQKSCRKVVYKCRRKL